MPVESKAKTCWLRLPTTGSWRAGPVVLASAVSSDWGLSVLGHYGNLGHSSQLLRAQRVVCLVLFRPEREFKYPKHPLARPLHRVPILLLLALISL